MKLEFNTEPVREKLRHAEVFKSSNISRLKQNVLNLKLIAILIKFDIAEAGKFLFIIQDLKLPLSISKSCARNLKHLLRVENSTFSRETLSQSKQRTFPHSVLHFVASNKWSGNYANPPNARKLVISLSMSIRILNLPFSLSISRQPAESRQRLRCQCASLTLRDKRG